MKIILDEGEKTFKFVPVEPGEAEIVSVLMEAAKPGDQLRYSGREAYSLKFSVGGTWEEEATTQGNLTIRRQVHKGGMQFDLQVSTPEDESHVRRIRDCCYFGSGGLIFLGTDDVDGKKALVVTVGLCKRCHAWMITLTECEWEVCDACAALCSHEYKEGYVHGGRAACLGLGEFCGECGRSNPAVEPFTILPHGGGIAVLNP